MDKGQGAIFSVSQAITGACRGPVNTPFTEAQLMLQKLSENAFPLVTSLRRASNQLTY